MKIEDIKDIIPCDCRVGVTDRERKELPFVDSWGNWKNGRLKTFDVEILQITTCGYLLLVLDA